MNQGGALRTTHIVPLTRQTTTENTYYSSPNLKSWLTLSKEHAWLISYYSMTCIAGWTKGNTTLGLDYSG